MHPTQATTVCNQETFAFQALGGRRVEADFSGGFLSSDGGSLLLREMDRRARLCERLAECFTDFRDAQFVEHELPVMLRQRILGLALGYEDINDHDRLRHDPLLAAVCGRADVLGEERHMEADRGRPPLGPEPAEGLAGKSTLNHAFIIGHARRNIAELNGERAAESATDLRVGHFFNPDAALAKQGTWLFLNTQLAQAGARIVIGDGAGEIGLELLHLGDIHQKIRQLVGLFCKS